MKKLKKYVLLILCVVIFCKVQSQNTEIIVQGKVKQAISGKGIISKIVYKSYPTGGLAGSFNDSTFSFSIFGSSTYLITAAAPDHIEGVILIKPEDAKNNRIDCEINITPKGQAIRLNHLIFDPGRDLIKPASFNELDGLVALMKANPKMEIQLEGHTDKIGSAELNQELSEKRVTAVKKYLSSKGIARRRIQTKAFGGSKPISTENTEEAHALNRRVEMRVLKD